MKLELSSKAAYILLGGRMRQPCGPAAALWAQLPPPSVVIAADGGAKHAANLGLSIDHWVGDFDSSQGLEQVQAPKQVHPTAKDQTDGELAIDLALQQGARALVLVGAFGGRFDHSATVILGAIRLAQQGLIVCLTSGDEWGWPLLPAQPLALQLAPQTTLSVVALSPLEGLSLSGVHWPLQQASIALGSGLTISNRSSAHTVRAALGAGYALLGVHIGPV